MIAASPTEKSIDAADTLPYRLLLKDNNRACEWLKLDGMRFTEPFFEDTIRRLKCSPANRKSILSGLDELAFTARDLNAVKPAAVIFHISRCGSTLVTQAFASSDRFIVLSEVPLFDDILRSAQHNGEDEIAALFKDALRFYALKRHTNEFSTMIKTDCWHIFFYDFFRTQYPDVPFVLLYRNPAEVLRSLMQLPGRQIIPQIVEPEIFGLPGITDYFSLAGYACTVLEKMLEKFLTVAKADRRTLLLSYNNDITAAPEKIANAAGLYLNSAEWASIRERMRFHSKKPREAFAPDPPATVPDSLMNAMLLYAELETLRSDREVGQRPDHAR